MDTPPPRPLLVLDLDETLWSGTLAPGAPVSFALRPHLGAFLRAVSSAYDLAVWTAASEDWMHAGLAVIRQETGFDLAATAVFLWHRSRCTVRMNEQGEHVFFKHARKFRAGWLRARYPRDRILVVDDSAQNYSSGYGHLVRVSSWSGAAEDTELERLAAYLLCIAGEPNLRTLEKRGWRSRVQPG